MPGQRLRKNWREAAANTDWLSLKDEILLTETRIVSLLEQLPEDEVATSKALTELAEQAGKNAERHARMAKDLHQMLSLDSVLAIMDRLSMLVAENVTDLDALRRIQTGMDDMLAGTRTLSG